MKDFTDQDVVYMIETILGYLDCGRVDEAKQHLENLQHWFIELPQVLGEKPIKRLMEEGK